MRRTPSSRAWLYLLGLGGVGGVSLPLIPVFIAVFFAVVLLAGLGAWIGNLFGPQPPAIATAMSRPAEWLASVTALTDRYGIPNVVALAVIEQASDGQAYGDRYYCSNQQSVGEPCPVIFHPGAFGQGSHGVTTLGIGVGLMGLNTRRIPGLSVNNPGAHAVAGNLATGIQRLANALHTAPDWRAGITAFHAGTQTPPGWVGSGQYAATILSLIQRYDGGPTLGAWALAAWSSKTGQFADPNNTPEWVFVVGTDPVGAAGVAAWAEPPAHPAPVCHTVTTTIPGTTTTRTVILRGPGGQRVAHTVTTTTPGRTVTTRHCVTPPAPAPPPPDLCGRTSGCTVARVVNRSPTTRWQDLSFPIQVWGTTDKGRHIAFTLSTANPAIPVWTGGSVWGARAPLTGPNALGLISAEWSNGVQDTIPWPEQSTGAVGTVHIVSDQQAITQWWPDIVLASQQSGTPADWIAAEMLVESHGDQYAGANGLAGAYGLMQLEPGTDGATNADRQNPLMNLIFGARYLAGLHQDTGSWRLASAAYYGGLGSVESAGWRPGESWTQAQGPLSRYVPFPSAGNTLTLAQYANDVEATSHWVAAHHPKPKTPPTKG